MSKDLKNEIISIEPSSTISISTFDFVYDCAAILARHRGSKPLGRVTSIAEASKYCLDIRAHPGSQDEYRGFGGTALRGGQQTQKS